MARMISIVSRVRRTGLSNADAVPTLHHLRPAGADAEDEPAAGQRLQRLRGHGEHRRRARAELRDAGASLIVDVCAGEVRERCECVAGPELAAPHRVDAEPLGLAHELDATRCRHGRGADADTQRHRGPSASCLIALDGALHVGLHLVDAAAQDARLLAGIVRDRLASCRMVQAP